MRVTCVYFCHLCNVAFALFSESKVRFTGPLFIVRVHLYSRACTMGVGKIADVHHEKGKRRAYTLVAVITLTKRRIAC